MYFLGGVCTQSSNHYYRKSNLSRLENPYCLDFPTENAPGQRGVFLSRVRQPGQKTTFCPGWGYQPGQKILFFPVFLFSILFLFQLYFCISIKLMYWNSVYIISTNIYIYIYIVTYIIFVLDSFHI